jgi:DNA-binding LacI/PurR family transcriptional regulator
MKWPNPTFGADDRKELNQNDRAPTSGFLTPSLTTARLDFAGLGRACFAMLL